MCIINFKLWVQYKPLYSLHVLQLQQTEFLVAAVMPHIFRLKKVSGKVVRCGEKETPPILNQMEFSG